MTVGYRARHRKKSKSRLRVSLGVSARLGHATIETQRDLSNAVISTVGALIIVLDRQGRVVRWNPACELATGYLFDEVRGLRPWELPVAQSSGQVPDDYFELCRPASACKLHVRELPTGQEGKQALQEHFERILRNRSPEPFQSVLVAKDGQERCVAWSSSAVKSSAGEIEYVVITGIDTTERCRFEREVQLAARHKDDFMAMLGHELRNPLAAIRSAVQLQALLGAADPRVLNARHIIARQSEQMQRLIDDLLDVSRIVRGKVRLSCRVMDVTALVRQIVDEQRPMVANIGLDLTLESCGGEPIWAKVDEARLVQIIDNLLSNAAKFTESPGSIVVRLRSDEGSFELAVCDTGVGISSETLQSMFEPFHQGERTLDRAGGGLGLGLALVRGLVELHNGTVSANSKGPGCGAEFTIRLPRCSAPSESCSSSAAPRAALMKRVLVVEDNRDAADVLCDLVALSGHEPKVAYSGGEALVIAETFKPHIVLCDIGLPDGISGYDVATRLRATAAAKEAYLVALTGYGRSEDRHMALQAGFDVHLTKPVDFEALRRLLQR